MSVELAIVGGRVADGSGRPMQQADLAVDGGRIVEIAEPGALSVTASRTIDATDRITCPGVVDLHTHYDAQLFWDPAATPSPLHGVTTVMAGNCGFGLAPLDTERDGDHLRRLMAKVEGIPLAALEAGVPWDWASMADYLDRLDGAVGPNVGVLAGHSALRRHVMGPAASERAATPEEVAALADLAERCLREGALGISTSRAPTHHDGDGRPVPSRFADDDELRALARACGRVEGTQLELILPGCISGFDDAEVALMAELSQLADRPLNWNVLAVTSLDPTGHVGQLDASTRAAALGGLVRALTIPHGFQVRISFLSGIPLDGLPGWAPVMALPPDERVVALADPDVRRRLDEGAQSPEAGLLGALANWGALTFFECHTPQTRPLEGRRVSEVARERGIDPFDCLLDVVVADGLRTVCQPPIPAETDEGWRLRAEVWRDPRSVVGGSDAGAHLDLFCGATYSTVLLGECVRERELLDFADAVAQLTDVPARLYGLRERGRVQEGWIADLMVVDPLTVGPHHERTRDDLPGGASRIYAGADGIDDVIVSGVPLVREGELTGATPGRVLRAGIDTATVSARAATGA